jgi:hypothetical protein
MNVTPPPTGPRARRSDLVLSVLLPAAVIGLGVALSVGTERISAFVDLCLSVIR